MDRCGERFGDVFTLRMLPAAITGPGARARDGEWVFLAEPDLVRKVFTADPSKVLTGPTNRFLESAVGARSILVLDEPEHMVQRKLLLPHFHGERVEKYRALIAEVTRAELAGWPIGQELKLWPRMQAITLEVIVRAVFGINDFDRRRQMASLLRDLLNRFTSARWVLWSAAVAVVKHRGGDPAKASAAAARRRMLGPVDDAILDEVRLRRRENNLDSRSDILSMLMQSRYEDGSPMSDEELRDELITLLVAGHESTATELAWSFERLLRHPPMLKRLREEAAVGADDYADAVVKETLRLRPVLPVVLRELVEPMELGGHRIPAGTWVAPCAYLIHRRPEIYDDPLRFRPERFLERPAGTYTWMPFGGGVRRCAGAAFAQLEMREVIQTVVAELDLKATSRRDERMRPRFITLAPSRGARASVQRRALAAG